MEKAALVAKMKLDSVISTETDQGKASEQLSLTPVYGKEGTANKQWSQWTPSGKLELQVNNPDAFGKVKPGYFKVYLVPCGEDD